MADQARRLAERGIESVTLSGGMSAGDKNECIKRLSSGKAKLALVNPEILATPAVRERLAELDIAHFVVDEAHCVSEWGDSFRPAYLSLAESVRALKPDMVTAFTATASSPVLARVADLLFGDEPYRLVMGSPDRPNIRYEATPALSMTRAAREAVRDLEKPMIVFAASRDGVAILAEDLRLSGAGPGARFYHAGLTREERSALEKWFLESSDGILCATCAYGLGMDKPNIRTMVHFGMPASVESYLQESGRAGRDGRQAKALLLYPYGPAKNSSGDSGLLRKMAAHGAARGAARRLALESWARELGHCRRSGLLGLLGYPEAASLACGGCDACEGTARSLPDGFSEISAAATRHARRFDDRGLARFLAGKAASQRDAVLSGLPCSGSLAAWTVDEAAEAIAEASRSGIVRRCARWPWKGKLKGTRQSSGNSESSSSGGGASGTGAFLARLRGKKERRSVRGRAARSSLAQGSAT